MIYNPFAGKLQRNPGLMERAVRILRERFGHLELRPTYGPNSATALARECSRAGAARVIVAGGDGTIHEAANGLVGTSTPMGLLPGGTANVLAMELRLGSDPLRVAGRLPDMVPVPVPVGVLHIPGEKPRHFLLMAGVGLDAAIVRAVQPGIKRRFGKLAYWLGGFLWLGKRLPEFDVRLNGKVVRGTYALASRVKNYGGDLEIARHADLLGDELAVVIFEGPRALPYLKYFSGVLMNRLEGMKGVTVTAAKSLEFVPANCESVDVQVDGELIGPVPARVEIGPERIQLLVPKELVSGVRQARN